MSGNVGIIWVPTLPPKRSLHFRPRVVGEQLSTWYLVHAKVTFLPVVRHDILALALISAVFYGLTSGAIRL